MKTDMIRWCKKQSKGIRVVEPSDSISDHYLQESRNDFDMISRSNDKWRIVTSYYACYNALYAILVKIGIKCEIHDCTIAIMRIIGFGASEIKFIEKLKKERVNVQYYLRPAQLHVDSGDVNRFLDICRLIMTKLNDDKINAIRTQLKNGVRTNEKHRE